MTARKPRREDGVWGTYKRGEGLTAGMGEGKFSPAFSPIGRKTEGEFR
jgi:hypothetical protein